MADVRLEPWGEGDLPLLRRLMGEPAMTEHLGGLESEEKLHAFPSVENAPSNAICPKLGFELLGEHDFEYPPGHPMRCNDWRLDLSETEGES